MSVPAGRSRSSPSIADARARTSRSGTRRAVVPSVATAPIPPAGVATSGVPDASFDQVNQPVAAAARHQLIERAVAGAPHSAVDAYAGLGATARALAARGITVTAIEADDAAAGFAADHLSGESRVVAARVEDVIDELLPADVVILNPPRAGVHAHVAEALESKKSARVIYMSCDPATLARDVARLPAYRVASLLAFDMFPQTAHVEVVCELIPEDA